MTTAKAEDIREFTLQDGPVRLSLLNLGAVTRGWWVPCGGASVPVVLGYDDPARYLSDEAHLGGIAGRVANRMTGGRLVLDGVHYQLSQNEGDTHLHGGAGGLNRRIWQADADSAGRRVRFTYHSPDGEEGYPGAVDFTVTISLDGSAVTYDMRAEVDRPTPINLAQHNYYALAGQAEIWDQRLTVQADRMTPLDRMQLPEGGIVALAGTRYDYQRGAILADNDPQRRGSDANLVLRDGLDRTAPVAELSAPNGLRMRMWSDQPDVQLYTAIHLAAQDGAHPGQRIAPFHGICLEPQGYPDAMNQPEFPSIVVTPEAPYRQVLTVDIAEQAP